VSQDDTQKTEEQRSVARGAELRKELAETDARRAEEDTARAHDDVVEDSEREEKLSRKEAAERERAESAAAEAEAEAERARAQAQPAPAAATPLPAGSSTLGLAERPEVLAGAAFAGSFVVARILKRIFD
jgi:FKBP-type peptidyl-prolyl cis-trans isomerase